MKHYIILFILGFSLIIPISAQVSFTGYMVDENDQKMKDVVVNLYKGNEKVSSKKSAKKFEFDLALETYYTVELVKEGFVTKRIAISTFEGNKGAEPFMFMMQLVAKKNQADGVDDEFPAALIKYKKDEGSFNFDVKYSKNLKKEQKEAAKKKKKD